MEEGLFLRSVVGRRDLLPGRQHRPALGADLGAHRAHIARRRTAVWFLVGMAGPSVLSQGRGVSVDGPGYFFGISLSLALDVFVW